MSRVRGYHDAVASRPTAAAAPPTTAGARAPQGAAPHAPRRRPRARSAPRRDPRSIEFHPRAPPGAPGRASVPPEAAAVPGLDRRNRLGRRRRPLVAFSTSDSSRMGAGRGTSAARRAAAAAVISATRGGRANANDGSVPSSSSSSPLPRRRRRTGRACFAVRSLAPRGVFVLRRGGGEAHVRSSPSRHLRGVEGVHRGRATELT